MGVSSVRVFTRLLSVILALTITVNVCVEKSLADSKLYDEHSFSDNYSDDYTDSDCGIDLYLVKLDDEYRIVSQTQREKYGASARSIGVFHVGVVRDSATTAHLYWTATGNQLTYVSAKIYCVKSSKLSPQTYYSGYIERYPDLNGTTGIAGGATNSFSVPSKTTKVKVGWKNAVIITVQDGPIHLPNSSCAVEL
jgi:hypothetical protein